MRIFGFVSVLFGVSLIVTGCQKHLTPQQAEPLLAKYSSSPVRTHHFTCQEGERGWLYICQDRSEPTAMAIQEGNNHRVPVRRVAVFQQGTYRGEPILNLAYIPDDGPIPSPEEFNDWANRELSRRNADAAANAAKRTERDSRVGK